MSSRSSSSPAGSPQSAGSNELTPTRKVQALLARFEDSDSDSAPVSKSKDVEYNARPATTTDDVSEDDDSLPVPSRSRIAARLQGLMTADNAQAQEHAETPQQPVIHSTESSESDEMLPKPTMRRRLLSKRKSSPAAATATHSPAQPMSPLFFPSPTVSRREVQHPGTTSSDSEELDHETSKTNSKFLALVEKHRKQRMEKEAEEAVKKTARLERLKEQQQQARMQRASSPADVTEEDSDLSGKEGGRKLSTQARPARKASKKALEEMNRETQRMNRNMQLAHQARTKKKITKDSLLARFNFSSTVAKNNSTDRTSTASSAPGSDTDVSREHDTPPTSPPQGEPFTTGNEKSLPSTVSAELPEHQPELASIRADKGKGRALSEEWVSEPILTLAAVMENSHPRLEDRLKPTIKPTIKQLIKYQRTQWESTKAVQIDESDSDLEVVTTKGDKRKYAAFEELPKRKASEMPSHLALRSLAHLIGSEDRKQSMNAAEMEMWLRKKARLQAREERQQKIEELKAKGVVIQTNEEREREQQEVEDLLEKARQEAVEIHKREKAQAKKEGNYVNDGLDDDDDESVQSADFENEDELEDSDISEDEQEQGDDEEEEEEERPGHDNLVDELADEVESENSVSDLEESEAESDNVDVSRRQAPQRVSRKSRTTRVLSDDEGNEDEDDPESTSKSPGLPAPAQTPQSLLKSARKQIPGLQMSDDLPIGLTQAFAATMADSESQETSTQEQDSLRMTMDLPSPNIAMAPRLERLGSIDVITDSQPASQTQPLNINLSFTQSQRVAQSPAPGTTFPGTQHTPSQAHFEPTQDGGYIMSPFAGNRFATETPQTAHPLSTLDTVILPADVENSPILQRKSRLRRGRADFQNSDSDEEADEMGGDRDKSAFDVMRRAAKQKPGALFDKTKSHAKEIVDEAAEESEDEYAGLGGASDEDINEEETEQDREMIDEDTQVGVGDELKLARLFADRERQQDEAAVSKLMKDITTGALRRKRANDDLDLSDEEDSAVRRREAKRREFAKMRRELLKDEAVGKIAEDAKKEAFLRSIEDRAFSDDEGDFYQSETPAEEESQDKNEEAAGFDAIEGDGEHVQRATYGSGNQPLSVAGASKVNQMKRKLGRPVKASSQRPSTLAEIRESVSFLIEEPDSQAATIDLGLSDSDDEPEAHVNLDRHLGYAEADENADDGDDLGDFIVEDDGLPQDDSIFKKPATPLSETRAPFSERRTKDKGVVVNRLSLIRQASSSSGSSASSKMAFYGSNASAGASFGKVPSLLRRATTNSSLGSLSGKNENVSATGVVTNKTERGHASEEKDFVRKGNSGRRNAVNYRPTMREEKMSQRAGIVKLNASKGKKASGFLGGLFKSDSWA